MKILALRGENLASLQDPFEIDFAEGRLGDVGLFAITGKTGAGKSTLLDAICLALFDRVPRLQANKKNDAEIGRDEDSNRLKANDVRNILSRGQSEGFAEVDFRAHDGSFWRAHWRVRRARGRADGRVQASEQWLENLQTGMRFAGKKQELQAEIERLIGLSFDQFRRAMMLPQGEFAAFLKAGADERAALLERMTGGEIYSRLSVAAHERAKDEKQKLDQLQAQLGGIALLDEDALVALGEQIAALEQQRAVSDESLSQTTGFQQRLTDFHQSSASLQQAIEAQQTAQLARDEAQARIDYFSQVEAAQPAKQTFDAMAKERQAIASKAQEREALQQKTAQNSLDLIASDEHVARQQRMQQQAQENWQAQEPKLKQALALDAQREEKQKQSDALKAQQLQAAQECRQQEAALQQAQQQQHYLEQQGQQLKAQLTQRSDLAPIAPQLESIADNLNQYRRAHQQRAQQQQQRYQLDQHQQQQKQELQWYQAEQQKVASQKQRLEQELSDANADKLSEQQHALQQQYSQKSQQIEQRNQQLGLAQDWLHVDHQYTALQQEQQQVEAAQQQGAESLSALVPELEKQQVQFKEAQHSFEQSRATLALEQYRVLLEDDAPCPLCGSVEHPYAKDHPVVESLLRQQQQRIEQLAHVIQQSESQRHYLSQQQQHFSQRLQQLVADLAKLSPIRTQLQQQIMAVIPPESECETRLITGLAGEWQREAMRLRDELQGLDRQYQVLQNQQRQVGHWQQQVAQLLQAEKELDGHVQRLTQAGLRFEEQLKALGEQEAGVQTTLTERAEALEQQFGGQQWQTLLQHEHYYHQFQHDVARYVEWQKASEAIAEQLNALKPQLSEQRTRVEALQQSLTTYNHQLQTLGDELAQLWQQRCELVGEQSLAELEAQLKQAVTVTQSALTDAQTQQRQLGEQRSLLEKEAQWLDSQTEQHQQSLETLVAEWQHWLSEFVLSEAQLQDLLAHDKLWREQEGAAISALDQAIAQAATRVEERQQMLGEQTEKLKLLKQWLGMELCDDLPLIETTLNERLAVLQSEQKQLDSDLFERKREHHEAVQAKQKAGELEQAWSKQYATTETWLKLNELIGSASGNKFRTLAQGLTLQQLVLVANEHLHDLAPRYALQPVPGAPLALQVIDHDMGDEVRSVESLSGGESFLMSLALALALASLAADTRQLGSLFIDEGFGTLDPESLEMALACLDALQAEGRQIGVISHVSTLVERIGIQVAVEAMGGGRSRVVLRD
uniref:AAA family ATPase n=1 Tax=Thaumasiovibrio occultus TaxID=1891184 RepID=UPI000B357D62|nr:AAA family ATPase [Thaumasiovibrio occultus]